MELADKKKVRNGHDIDALRLPPQNLEAEQTVIGAMMINADVIAEVTEIISKSDNFYRQAHGLIYQSIVKLFSKGEPADPITVAEDLSGGGNLEAIGGKPYLHTLVASVPTAANARYYAQIVAKTATLRSIIKAAGEIAEIAYNPPDEIKETIDTVEHIIYNIGKERISEGFRHLKDVVDEAFEQITALHDRKSDITGLSTGFRDLDQMLSGFHASDLLVLAARPSMGKSSLAINIAQHIGMDGNPVAIFSLEMSRYQLAQRMLCSEARVSSTELRTGKIAEDDWIKVTHAAGKLTNAPIYIDDSADLTVMELRSKARRLKARVGDLSLIVIDYLQLMRGNLRSENRQQEISEISRSLKSLARELSIPILALSQLSRAVETRQGNKRPQLSDLRESGAIEQDADVVMFIYRDDYYNAESEHPGEAEILIAKHRNGPVGKVNMVFLEDYTKFADLARS